MPTRAAALGRWTTRDGRTTPRARSRGTVRALERSYDATSRTARVTHADGAVTFQFDVDAPVMEDDAATVVEDALETATEGAAADAADARTPEPERAEAVTAPSAVNDGPTWVGESSDEDDGSVSRLLATPLSKMKKAELAALCEELGLDASGTVAALRGRLAPVVRGRSG